MPGRREMSVTWPSTQIRPSRLIHPAIERATVRTGSGDSAVVSRPTSADLTDSNEPLRATEFVGPF